MEPQTNPVPQTEPAPAPAPTPTETKPEIPSVPKSWPGAFGLYKYSKKAISLNAGTIIGLWVLTFVVQIAFTAFLNKNNLGDIVGSVISIIFEIAVLTAYISSVRGQKMSFGESFSKLSPAMFFKIFALSILTTIVAGLSLVALIIPFFFVWPRLALANYFLVDKNMGIMEAFKASWNSAQGNVGKLYGIVGANIAMFLLMITIIGIPFSIYFLIMYSAATALLYEFVINQTPAPEAVPSAEPFANPQPTTNPEPPVSMPPSSQPPQQPPAI